MKYGLLGSFAATLFVTTAALIAIPAPGTVEAIAQPHAIRPGDLDARPYGKNYRHASAIFGGAVAFPCFLHSLTPDCLPIDSASQHVSSGVSVDEDWLRLIPTLAVPHMAINFFGGVRMSAAAFAVGAMVTACGGGGGGSDGETTQAGISSSNTGTSSTTAGTSTSSAGTTTTTAGTSTATAGTSTDTSSTSTDTTAVAPPTTSTASANDGSTANETTTVASTSTGSADTLGTLATTSTAPPIGTTIGTVVAPTTTTGKSKRSGAGLNLGPVDIYSTGVFTVDLMKRSSAWLTQCQSWTSTTCNNFASGQSAFDTLEESKLDLDAQGWVKSLPANNDSTVKYRMVMTALLSGGTLPDGQYIVKYDGQGTLAYSGGASKVAASSTAGRDVVQISNAKGGFFLAITATTPSNYLRNIRVYAPGGACANDYSTYAADATACGGTKGAYVAFESFPANKPWFPSFFTDVKGFRTLRYMDWMRTNTTPITDWAKRSLPTDRSWAGANGVPLESIIDLSNDTATDPWVNIPPYATDDYVHQFARLAHQRLSSSLKLNLEYANEAWNYAFPATNWMLAQGKTTWATQVAAGANVYSLELNWYAQRLAQVCTIAKQEFGADASRVTCIANTQAALPSNTDQVLACTYAAASLGKPCAKFFDVVSIAPYFGFYLGIPTYRAAIGTWYSDPDGGLTKLFEELNGADPTGAPMLAPLASLTKWNAGARSMSNAWMVGTKAVADKYGLPMWAYEGGQHLVPPGGDTDAAFLNLITTANRDPRMQAAYQQDLADWKAAGGQTFTYYNHVGIASKYGMWGAKLTLDDNSAPKWKAVTQARDATSCWWSGC